MKEEETIKWEVLTISENDKKLIMEREAYLKDMIAYFSNKLRLPKELCNVRPHFSR